MDRDVVKRRDFIIRGPHDPAFIQDSSKNSNIVTSILENPSESLYNLQLLYQQLYAVTMFVLTVNLFMLMHCDFFILLPDSCL